MSDNYINLPGIAKVIASMVLSIGVFMLFTASLAWIFYGDDLDAFLWSVFICFVFGGSIKLIFSRAKRKRLSQFRKRDAYLCVTLIWVAISAFGALPFYIYGATPSYVDAFFETMSGFTTTGASMLSDIEGLPKGLLFWRSLTHWIGGIGIVVFSLAILPIMGIGGNQMFAAESTGPSKDKLHPRIAQSAKRLCLIYVILTVIQTLMLLFGDMPLFDSICHAFGTISTGGFSTKNDSIMSYSPYIQYVIAIFMFLGGVNFAIYYYGITGKFDKIWKNSELKGYILFTFIAILMLTLMLCQMRSDHLSVGTNIRDSVFTCISIITTTGFISADYSTWIPSTNLLIFAMMLFGACAGSTSGGIKIVRHMLLFKNTVGAFKQLIHQRAVLPVKMNGSVVPQNVIVNVLAFFFLYILILAVSALIMSIAGYSLETSLGVSASCLGNVGPGLGSVCATCNYSALPIYLKWMLSALMLIGRLELFTVLLIFTPVFWKK